MQTNQHDNDWERKWLEGEISSQEASKSDPNGAHFDILNKYVEAASSLEVKEKTSHADAWSMLEQAISKPEETKVIPISRRYWLTGIAASFILIATTLFLLDPFSRGFVEIDTALAETQIIYLPDSSAVYLNAESQISYSSKSWDEERVINLVGEAFFEVKRGSNFKVTTDNGMVEVLGTSFNVRSRGGELDVACKTGKVRVTSFNQESKQVLTPGLQARVKNNEVKEPTETNIQTVDSWRTGQYFLESITIKEGFEELERIFNMEVVHTLPEFELARPGSWDFDVNSLQESIQSINITMGLNLKYKTEDGKIIFEQR